MRRFSLLAVIGMIFLTGCTNLSKLSREVRQGDDYYAFLSNEYLAYSMAESEQYDWYDSEYFAKKGLKASAGINVQPENPGDWDVPSDQYDKLMRERRRLVVLVNGPARNDYTEKVAHAQVLYDCWVEQVDEQMFVKKESVCAHKFAREIADIESQILLAAPPVPTKDSGKKSAVESEHTIFFGLNLTELTERGKAVVREVSDMVKEMAGYSVKVDGYTDSIGSAEYNIDLSKNRANRVAQALANEGVDEQRISTEGHGENDQLVPTADGVIEHRNRRVEITVTGQR